MSDVRGSVWSDGEVDAIVADYFDMLADELAGEPYNKAQHNEALQGLIPRSRKSIEFKHCNISAVLERLGIPYIPGYRPLAHFQNALIDAVERYLASSGQPIFQFAAAVPERVAESLSLWIGPPPSVSPQEQHETVGAQSGELSSKPYLKGRTLTKPRSVAT